MAAITSATIIRQSPRVAYRAMAEGEGGLLLHLDSGAYHGVNTVGAAMWEILAADPTLEELVTRLRSVLEDAPSYLDDDVRTFLLALEERQLIEFRSPPEAAG